MPCKSSIRNGWIMLVTETMGINIRTDQQAGRRYADLIIDGEKTLESRNRPTLKCYEGRRMGIIRTGEGRAKLCGFVTVGKGFEVSAEEFRKLEGQHLVPESSEHDVVQSKWLYPMLDPQRCEEVEIYSKGMVARRIDGEIS